MAGNIQNRISLLEIVAIAFPISSWESESAISTVPQVARLLHQRLRDGRRRSASIQRMWNNSRSGALDQATGFPRFSQCSRKLGAMDARPASETYSDSILPAYEPRGDNHEVSLLNCPRLEDDHHKKINFPACRPYEFLKSL